MQFDQNFLAALGFGYDEAKVNVIAEICDLMQKKWHCYSRKGRNVKAQQCVDAFLSIREKKERMEAWKIMYKNQRFLEYIIDKLPQDKLWGELLE